MLYLNRCIYRLERRLRLLVDPVVLGGLPAGDLVLLEPESDLLLGVLDRVGTVADVAADVNGEVATDGARSGGSGVGGTEKGTASLDGVTALPDHGADGSRVHVCREIVSSCFGACRKVIDVQEIKPRKKGLSLRSE